jgi:hypothetical protein
MNETPQAAVPSTVKRLALRPQPRRLPFKIVGDKSGRFYNEREAFLRTGRGPMFIAWTPPRPDMIPVQRDGVYAWEPMREIGRPAQNTSLDRQEEARP